MFDENEFETFEAREGDTFDVEVHVPGAEMQKLSVTVPRPPKDQAGAKVRLKVCRRNGKCV